MTARAAPGKRAGQLVFLLALALVVPGANYQLWDGLPFDSGPEALTAAVLVPFVFSRRLRGQLGELLARVHPRALAAAVIVLALVIGCKLLLLAAGGEEGFRACYTSPVAAPPGGGCERSYGNLFDRYGGATRIEPTISNGPLTQGPGPTLSESAWNLSFFNDLRFAPPAPPATPANPDPRARLPLSGHWTGRVDLAPRTTLIVSYVGRGLLRVGSRRLVLPPSYRQLRPPLVALPAAAGVQRFSLTFAYRPPAVRGASAAPYAALRVSAHPVDHAVTPLYAAPPPAGWAAFGAFAEIGLGMVLALVAATALMALGVRQTAALIVLGLLAGALAKAGGDYSGWLDASLLAVAGAALVVLRPRHPYLLCWYGVVLACATHPLIETSVGHVAYQTADNDWLLHASFARSMLTGSLRGGEGVFYYQPGAWRYVLFAERAFLGDGDVLRLIFAFASVSFGMIAMALATLRQRGARLLAGAAILVVALLLLNAPQLRLFLALGASESVAWALVPPLVALPFVRPAQAWPWVAAPAAAALLVITRPNHLLAALLLIAVFALAAPPARRRALKLGIGLALVIGLLPSLHDLIYGDRLHLALTSGPPTANFDIPPDRVFDIFAGGAVWREFRLHLEHILGLSAPPGTSAGVALLLHALLVCWLVALVLAIRRRRAAPRWHLLLVALPVAFLLPHLLYNVDVYFPRHIIAGYIAMAATTIAAIGVGASQRAGPRALS